MKKIKKFITGQKIKFTDGSLPLGKQHILRATSTQFIRINTLKKNNNNNNNSKEISS